MFQNLFYLLSTLKVSSLFQTSSLVHIIDMPLAHPSNSPMKKYFTLLQLI